MWLKQSEDKCRLKLRRIYPKRGGCAERNSDQTFRYSMKGRYGTRLSYFVAQDVLCLLGDPKFEANAINCCPS